MRGHSHASLYSLLLRALPTLRRRAGARSLRHRHTAIRVAMLEASFSPRKSIRLPLHRSAAPTTAQRKILVSICCRFTKAASYYDAAILTMLPQHDIFADGNTPLHETPTPLIRPGHPRSPAVR
jgi:hypothetical protein